MLFEKGIVKNNNTLSYNIFNEAVSNDFLSIPNMTSSEYVRYCWNKYTDYCSEHPQDNSTNGNIFELIVESELYRKNYLPMFLQAKVAFVPNVKFDILLYSSDNYPIGLSLKTSLRERYKQADLEAIALKYVHRRALNYLITLDSDEADNVKEKLCRGELLGINKVIAADTEEFDELISEFGNINFINPGSIDIITAGNIVR